MDIEGVTDKQFNKAHASSLPLLLKACQKFSDELWGMIDRSRVVLAQGIRMCFYSRIKL